MAKIKTTQKAIKNAYPNILVIPYCELQHLLVYETAYYYTAGVYGWNADVYVFDNVAICTGYRPYGTHRPSHALVTKYDKMAYDYLHNGTRDYKGAKSYLNNLINAFIKEVQAEQKEQSNIK